MTDNSGQLTANSRAGCLHRAAVLTLTIVFSLTLTACRNYQELGGFDFATGLSIDWAGGQYEVTVEILDLMAAEAESAVTSIPVKSRGETLPRALESLDTRLSRGLHLGNLQNIIIGEGAAREIGMRAIFDWLSRDAKVRETVQILVARGYPAAKILEAPGVDNPIASYAIANILTPVNGVFRGSKKATLFQAYSDLEEQGRTLSLPSVTLSEESNGEEKQTVAIAGLAVFDGDRLTAHLGIDELPIILLLKNHLEQTELVFHDPRGPVTAQIERAGGQWTVSQGKVGLHAVFRADIEAALLQLPPGIGPLETDEIAALETYAARTLENLLSDTLERLQKDVRLDVICLGYELYLRNTPLWEQVKDGWPEPFQTMTIDVHANVRVRNTGIAKKS